jgi:hypothetical protein
VSYGCNGWRLERNLFRTNDTSVCRFILPKQTISIHGDTIRCTGLHRCCYTDNYNEWSGADDNKGSGSKNSALSVSDKVVLMIIGIIFSQSI